MLEPILKDLIQASFMHHLIKMNFFKVLEEPVDILVKKIDRSSVKIAI